MNTNFKNASLFTLAVLVLFTLCLHGIAKMRVSINATADETARTYLLNKPSFHCFQGYVGTGTPGEYEIHEECKDN